MDNIIGRSNWSMSIAEIKGHGEFHFSGVLPSPCAIHLISMFILWCFFWLESRGSILRLTCNVCRG